MMTSVNHRQYGHQPKGTDFESTCLLNETRCFATCTNQVNGKTNIFQHCPYDQATKHHISYHIMYRNEDWRMAPRHPLEEHLMSDVVVVVVVLTLTRIIKSVVTGQAPVTLELRNTLGKTH